MALYCLSLAKAEGVGAGRDWAVDMARVGGRWLIGLIGT